MARKNNNVTVIVFIVIALAALGLGYMGYKKLKWIEEERDLGYGERARSDEFLAAAQFLDALGIETETVVDRKLIYSLPEQGAPVESEPQGRALAANDTLMMVNSRGTLNEEKAQRLLAWVDRGGRLIYTVENPFVGEAHDYDPVLTEFGLATYSSSDDDYEYDESEESDEEYDDTTLSTGEDSEEAEPESESDDERPSTATKKKLDLTEEQCFYTRPKYYDLPSLNAPIKLAIWAWPEVIDYDGYAPHNALFDDGNLILAQFEHGEGEVVVITSADLWQNETIYCLDHALLLGKIVNPDGKFWILKNFDAPSLWSVMWRNAPYGLALSFLALFLWLWHKFFRFGPLLQYSDLSRRSFSEHLLSSAKFLWRNKQAEILIERLRADVTHRIKIRYMHYPDLIDQEKLDLLESICSLPRVDLYQAMIKPIDLKNDNFVELVSHLKTIKECI
jgi:biotin operon repressor